MFKTYLAVSRAVRPSAEERAMGVTNKRYTLVDISDPTAPRHKFQEGFVSTEQMLEWITWQVTVDPRTHDARTKAYTTWATGGYYTVEGEKPERTECHGPSIDRVLAQVTIIEAS